MLRWRPGVFELAVTDGRAADFYTRVPVLFDVAATHDELLARIKAGGKITVAPPTPAKEAADPHAAPGATGMPMFVNTPGNDLRVLAAGERPPLEPEQELIGLTERS